MCLGDSVKKVLSVVGGMLLMAAMSSSSLASSCAPYYISYIRVFDNSDVRYSQTLWMSSLYIISLSLSATMGGILTNRFKLNLRVVALFGSIIIR